MKDIKETLMESLLLEAADRDFKQVLGKRIVFVGRAYRDMINIGMDFRHEHDIFTVISTGDMTYTNPYLFAGVITAHIPSRNLNRIVSAGDKSLKVADCGDYPTLDVGSKPKNLFRAVLNALTHKNYMIFGDEVRINELDYTVGDFQKDKDIDVA